MNRVAASFAWPFSGSWRAAWATGIVMVLAFPLTFIPLFGYAIAATRNAAANPAQGPPPLVPSLRLLWDGLWTALVLFLLTVPFVVALRPLATALNEARLWHVSDPALSYMYALVGAAFSLALPWGLVLLLLVPHSVRRFASTGRPLDLFNFSASIRQVRRDFATWNLDAAAMVTAWAIGLACAGLLCVGVVPGIFYAILVCAHACAALEAAPEVAPRQWPLGQGSNPPAG